MVKVPVDYIIGLETEFEKVTGYDADEDTGYFLEWLIERLWNLEREKGTTNG